MQNRTLKIAIINHHPGIGGAEASILTLLRKIDRSRFNVTVVLPSEGSFSEELRKIKIRVEILFLPQALIRLKRGDTVKSFFFILTYFFRIQIFLMRLCIYFRKNHFDLILTNTVKAHLYGSIAARLCRIPLVWRFHDILSSPDFSPLWIKSVRFFGNLFPTKILAVSNTARDYLVRNGLKRNKVKVIFSGVDNPTFEAKGSSKDIREEFKLGDKIKLVGCLGRVVPQKGHRSFLLSIPKVVDVSPETFFLIIGDFLKEEEYREELLEIVRKKRIEDRVKFTGFRSDIGDVIRSLDIVVFPSVAPESFGLSILEAMHLGKPVIASNLEGIRELIEDGVTGMLVEPDRPEEIADRIIDLFRDKELYEKIGRKAKEEARRFSLENYVGSMEKVCGEVALNEVNP